MGELRGWQAKFRDGKEQGELLGRGRAYRYPSDTSFELLHEGPEPWSGEWEGGCIPYLSLDHVDTSGTEGLHAVVNVYDALPCLASHPERCSNLCDRCPHWGESGPGQVRALQREPGAKGKKRRPGAAGHGYPTQWMGYTERPLPRQGGVREKAAGRILVKCHRGQSWGCTLGQRRRERVGKRQR